jgi:type I restriction enzyme R subunit
LARAAQRLNRRSVTNAGTNALIVRAFMEESIKDPSGVLPGKSIFFAISKGRARRLQELFDRMYPEHAGKLARVLVSDDRFVYGKGGLLDQFKTQDMPRVAISVDLLDTGVDCHEVVNLVFAKPVYSYTKFWQMIGRGTRVLDADPTKRRPWCQEKDKFLIIDCWGNFEFFSMNPEGREPGAQVPLPVRLFRSRLDKLEAALAAGREDIASKVKDDLRRDIADLPANNVVVADSSGDLAKVAEVAFWTCLKGKDIGFLRSVIAPVLRARSDADFKAMRFETGVVELAERLSPLMCYRQRRRDPLMKLDLGDVVALKEWVEFEPQHERVTSSVYRARVEAAVRALVKDNLVLQKLQVGEPVTGAEIAELARLLHEQDPLVTEETLREVYDHKTAHFIQFIRHILGLEELGSWSETVTRAFDELIAAHSMLTTLQIRFLQTLRTFILQNRKVERRDLIAAPFTRIHPSGIRGVFASEQTEEIIKFAERLVAWVGPGSLPSQMG